MQTLVSVFVDKYVQNARIADSKDDTYFHKQK